MPAAPPKLFVKGKAASPHQLDMGRIVVGVTKQRGGDGESMAGAVATAIQESTLSNIPGGDRDSVGLFQQRPSCGWGTYAQCHDPIYATNKFCDKYLSYRKKGEGWLIASHHTQASAFPSAPAPWFNEGQAFAAAFAGSGGDLSSFATAGGDALTGTQPYEYARGSADKPEDSWTCSGRLADEVQFRRFMRGGGLWYVSDQWLVKQRPVYRVNEFSPGVVELTFDFETRKAPAEAKLKVVSKRYAFRPGDVVTLVNEGPGDGNWLVSTILRDLFTQITEVTLIKPRPILPEPAPQAATASVGGNLQLTTVQGVTGPDQAVQAYSAAETLSKMNLPYSQAQRNLTERMPSSDCSSGVSWVLLHAGIPLPGGVGKGQWAPVSGAFEGWGEAGPGKYFTIMCNAGHIWIRWNGIGPAWRMDTSSYGDSYTASSGGRNRTTPRPTTGFVQRHWHGM